MNGVSAILIVEDHPLDLDLTRRAFARRELANPLQVARDGQEALDFIERWDTGMPLPAVILLDLKLPRVSGLEVLRRIKKHPRFQIISVVILTSSAEDIDIENAYHLGAIPTSSSLSISKVHGSGRTDRTFRGLLNASACRVRPGSVQLPN